jgi:gamma-glutamyltranspeptidase/glutathione hydrolase
VKPAILQIVLITLTVMLPGGLHAANAPIIASDGMVVSQEARASRIGAEVLRAGGTAVDAAVATAFALAVTHPTAGNIGGGGFLLFRPVSGEPLAYDFREVAPSGSHPEMWLANGEYSFERHHFSHMAVGVPGTVAGLHRAWQAHGKLPWRRLVEPAIVLAREGFPVTHELARSLAATLPRMQKYPASIAQFSRAGTPYAPGDLLRQPDLADSLERIAEAGPAGFYKGRTAELIVQEMSAHGGLITLEDLARYEPRVRTPLRGTYRGYEVLSMPPPSSGGTALIAMLNILEGYPVGELGFGTTATLHRMAESMRRAFADRARFLGDPDFNQNLPIERLTSKSYADELRASIDLKRASKSSPTSFDWPAESTETTHLSVVDKARNAVALTYTLEYGYGSGIVVPGAGFLLNNEMGDFNAGPGLTNDQGLIGTPANLAEPGKRMLSSMTPTILARDDRLFMVTGSPGGRTIINTVLQTILNVVDHGMNAQTAVDAGRVHHQWLPDVLAYERHGFSLDSLNGLKALGHTLREIPHQGVAEVIVVDAESGALEAGVDYRVPDGAAAGD